MTHVRLGGHGIDGAVVMVGREDLRLNLATLHLVGKFSHYLL